MRIVWSATAIANLAQIRKYIEQDSPAAAARVAQRILASVERLAKHPHLGRPGREPRTRELIVAGTPYIIPYTVHSGRLAILAVLHAAQHDPRK
ncbi:MAG: type II toxin-antitoxin system RelE/ParE family toxin [Candidatus Acidiferrales bacterium]